MSRPNGLNLVEIYSLRVVGDEICTCGFILFFGAVGEISVALGTADLSEEIT